jgi:hypothetical protein
VPVGRRVDERLEGLLARLARLGGVETLGLVVGPRVGRDRAEELRRLAQGSPRLAVLGAARWTHEAFGQVDALPEGAHVVAVDQSFDDLLEVGQRGALVAPGAEDRHEREQPAHHRDRPRPLLPRRHRGEERHEGGGHLGVLGGAAEGGEVALLVVLRGRSLRRTPVCPADRVEGRRVRRRFEDGPRPIDDLADVARRATVATAAPLGDRQDHPAGAVRIAGLTRKHSLEPKHKILGLLDGQIIEPNGEHVRSPEFVEVVLAVGDPGVSAELRDDRVDAGLAVRRYVGPWRRMGSPAHLVRLAVRDILPGAFAAIVVDIEVGRQSELHHPTFDRLKLDLPLLQHRYDAVEHRVRRLEALGDEDPVDQGDQQVDLRDLLRLAFDDAVREVQRDRRYVLRAGADPGEPVDEARGDRQSQVVAGRLHQAPSRRQHVLEPHRLQQGAGAGEGARGVAEAELLERQLVAHRADELLSHQVHRAGLGAGDRDLAQERQGLADRRRHRLVEQAARGRRRSGTARVEGEILHGDGRFRAVDLEGRVARGHLRLRTPGEGRDRPRFRCRQHQPVARRLTREARGDVQDDLPVLVELVVDRGGDRPRPRREQELLLQRVSRGRRPHQLEMDAVVVVDRQGHVGARRIRQARDESDRCSVCVVQAAAIHRRCISPRSWPEALSSARAAPLARPTASPTPATTRHFVIA